MTLGIELDTASMQALPQEEEQVQATFSKTISLSAIRNNDFVRITIRGKLFLGREGPLSGSDVKD